MSADLPKLIDLSPAFARRAWLKWLADREPFTGDLAQQAAFVGLAIDEWDHHYGKPTTGELSRKNLEEKLATFQAALPAD